MTFRVEKTGSIMLFNHTQEAIFFNTPEGPQTLTLPDTFLYSTFVEDPDPGYETFEESDIGFTNPEGTIYEWTWTREYTGSIPLIERYYISLDGGNRGHRLDKESFHPCFSEWLLPLRYPISRCKSGNGGRRSIQAHRKCH